MTSGRHVTMRRHGTLRRRGTLALVAALLLTVAGFVAAPAGLVAPAEVRGAATDLTLVTQATYTVRPDAGRVGVAVAIQARNRTSETRTRRYWFDHAFLAVQPGAAAPRLAAGSKGRVRVVNRTARATMLRIDFGRRLYSGSGASFRLLFELPGAGRKASPEVRVGDSLVTVPVWAFASNGVRGSTVAVSFPEGWDVAVESGELPRREATADGGTILSSGPIDAPLRYFAYVTAQRPATYVDKAVTIPVGDQSVAVVLQGWADDPGWSRRMQRQLAAALPVLAEDIGLPWPMAEPLVIHESASRDANTWAGRYDPETGTIEVAYWADPAVVVRQLAHAWFNGSLLADRWANEGFASWYALRAAKALDLPMEPPTATDEALAEVGPLAEWTGADALPPTAASPDPDAAAVAAAHRVAAEIAERVGPETLAATWADVVAGTAPYQLPGANTAAGRETVDGPPDWRRLLDLLETRSGEDLDALWRDAIVPADAAAELDAREEAGLGYQRTLAIAGDWQLPRSIRDALRTWQFATAGALMADARTVLAQRNAVADLADREGLVLPGSMEGLFETGSLAEASAQAEGEQTAIQAIEAAQASRSADDDLVSRIGMLGENPDADIAAAQTSLAEGDLAATISSAERAQRAWTEAWQEGRRRGLLAIALLATLLVLGSAVVAQVRRSRRPRPGPMAHPMAGPTASASADVAAPGDDAAPA